MIKLDIIYGHSINLVHGVNYVTDMFVRGKQYLKNENIILQYIYHDKGRIKCENSNTIFEDVKEKEGIKIKESRFKNKLIKILKSRIFVFEIIRFFIRNYIPAKKTINNYINYNNSDCIIFQDFITAYLYFKNKNIEHNKSLLIMHTSGDFLEMLKSDKPTLYKNKYFRDFYINMFSIASANVNNLVVLSRVAFDSFPNISQDKKVIIHNGIDKFIKTKKQIYLPQKPSTIKFVCVGHLLKRKGQHLVIQAISKLDSRIKDKISLYLIGDGQEKETYKILIDKLNLKDTIFLLGKRSDVPELLEKMNVFISPSFSEGLPISIIEAIRAGLYVMTTPVGGCAELIKPEFGEIIELDSSKISKSIEDLIIRGIPNESCVYAKKYFLENLTLDIMMKKYAKTIIQIQ
ncbi:MAG: glycosyltransferase [Tissierellia bacterium]|nr:glycosyltransferase [Tissierellia bacterium]MDD4781634.1 glycosyltransferase [Tissierellia bacterium]